jgi:hypothetical protein
MEVDAGDRSTIVVEHAEAAPLAVVEGIVVDLYRFAAV